MKQEKQNPTTHTRSLLKNGIAYYITDYNGPEVVIRTQNGQLLVSGHDCEILGTIAKVERSQADLLTRQTVVPKAKAITIGDNSIPLCDFSGPALAIRTKDTHILITSKDCEILGAVDES